MQKNFLTLSLLWFVLVLNHVSMTMLAWIFHWWLCMYTYMSRCLPMCTSSSNRSVPMQDRPWLSYWYSFCCDGVCAGFSWQIGSLGRELVQLQQESHHIKEKLRLSQEQPLVSQEQLNISQEQVRDCACACCGVCMLVSFVRCRVQRRKRRWIICHSNLLRIAKRRHSWLVSVVKGSMSKWRK